MAKKKSVGLQCAVVRPSWKWNAIFDTRYAKQNFQISFKSNAKAARGTATELSQIQIPVHILVHNIFE